jgi:pyruvate/2-oxoglutarate/acetoin dehydrogenase E1 component
MAEAIKHAQPANPTKEMRVQEALREALRYEMARDSRVFVMGEDVALFGGAYGVTRGLMQEFGENRVLDTPISEAALVGLGVGAAITACVQWWKFNSRTFCRSPWISLRVMQRAITI